MDERLVAEAQAQGAPCLPRELAVRRIGADAHLLEAQRRAHAQESRSNAEGRHLRGASEPGRALANGDVLRIEAITAGAVMVRWWWACRSRVLEAVPASVRQALGSQAGSRRISVSKKMT